MIVFTVFYELVQCYLFNDFGNEDQVADRSVILLSGSFG